MIGVCSALFLTAALLAGVGLLIYRFLPFVAPLDGLLATCVGAAVLLILSMEGLSAVACMRFAPLAVVCVGCFAVGLFAHYWRRRRPIWKIDPPPESSPIFQRISTAVVGGFVASLAVRWLLSGLIQPVQPNSDGPIYHLPFAIWWRQAGCIELRPTPFGELAATYFPANGDLWLSWLVIAAGDETLAKVGQWPFLAITCTAIYGFGRQLGANRSAALLPALCFSSFRAVLATSAVGLVDLFFTAWYVTALYFLLRSRRATKRAESLFLLGAFAFSAGVALGTKTIGVVVTPLLLVPAILYTLGASDRPLRLLLLLLGVALPSAFWYGRDLLLAGNPLYPLDIAVFGRRLLFGWYNSAAMREGSDYHVAPFSVENLKLVLGPVVDVRIAWVAPIASAAALLAWPFSRRSKSGRAFAAAGALAIAYFLLYWFVIPYNTQWRFLLPGAAIGFLPLAWAAHRFPWLGSMLVLWLGWSLLSAEPAGSWTSPGWHWAVFAVLTLSGWGLLHGRRRLAPSLAVIAVVACVLIAIVVGGRNPDWARFTPTGGFANDLFPAWRTLQNATARDGANVAYAGTNLPYYLFGPGLKNRVEYVNIAGDRDWLPHDFHLARLRQGESGLAPTPWPEWHRQTPDFDVWTANLAARRIQFIFVARENLHGRKHLPRAAPFPIEYHWMTAHPERFKRLGPFANSSGAEPWGMVFQRVE